MHSTELTVWEDPKDPLWQEIHLCHKETLEWCFGALVQIFISRGQLSDFMEQIRIILQHKSLEPPFVDTEQIQEEYWTRLEKHVHLSDVFGLTFPWKAFTERSFEIKNNDEEDEDKKELHVPKLRAKDSTST